MPESTQATLCIFTESGQQVFSQRGEFPQGYNAVILERSQLPATGLLYYELSTATDHAVRKMVVME